MYFKICEYFGAYLDPGERCDFQEQAQEEDRTWLELLD